MSSAPLHIAGSAGETFGRVLRTRAAGEFLLRESRYLPVRLPPHYHPRAYFSFIVRGSIEEKDRRAARLYPTGSLHVHAPGDPHAGSVGPSGLTCLSIVPLGTPQKLLAGAALPTGILDPTLSLLAARCHRELAEGGSISDLALEGLALELLAAALRLGLPREARAPRWVRDVRDYLHAHVTERVTLADLTGIADVHPVHLVRAFRSHVGSTPAAYQRRLRIEQARCGLVDSDTPIADLSLEAGFAGQAHFTRWFRRLVGTTPAAYRRAHRRRAG